MPTVKRDRHPREPRHHVALGATVAMLTVGLVASLVAARFTGAAADPPAGITDAGPVVRAALPLVRVVTMSRPR